MDMNEMSFEPASFDVILEKGTLDVILTSETSPWDVTKSTEDKFHNIISQVNNIYTWYMMLRLSETYNVIPIKQIHFLYETCL